MNRPINKKKTFDTTNNFPHNYSFSYSSVNQNSSENIFHQRKNINSPPPKHPPQIIKNIHYPRKRNCENIHTLNRKEKTPQINRINTIGNKFYNMNFNTDGNNNLEEGKVLIPIPMKTKLISHISPSKSNPKLNLIINDNNKNNLILNNKNNNKNNDHINNIPLTKFNPSPFPTSPNIYMIYFTNNPLQDLFFSGKIKTFEQYDLYIKNKGPLLIESYYLLRYCNLIPEYFNTEYNYIYKRDKNNVIKISNILYKSNTDVICYALNISKYKNENNNNWLNNNNEWMTAFHGIGGDNINQKTGNIVLENLKAGPRQMFRHAKNINLLSSKLECGGGVYLTPYFNIADDYAKEFNYKGKILKIIIMARVKISKIRQPNNQPNYFILGKSVFADNNFEEVRPFKILIKSNIFI